MISDKNEGLVVFPDWIIWTNDRAGTECLLQACFQELRIQMKDTAAHKMLRT